MTNRYLFVGIALFLLLVGGIYFYPSNNFTLSNDDIVRDVQTKWVVLSPQGQLWGFAPDQRINIRVLDKKITPEGLDVAVNLNAIANVPDNKEPPKELKATPSTPITQLPRETPAFVELTGVAKLRYELIGGQWYLISVDSVNLTVRGK